MPDYASNSKKSKKADAPEEKKIEPVVSSPVSAKKRPLGKRFVETFFGGDVKSAAQYLLAEILLPEARRILVEAAWKGTERVVFGDSKARPRSSSSYGPTSRYNYTAHSDPRERRYASSTKANLPDQPTRGQVRTRSSEQDLVFANRAEAETVVEALSLLIDQYDVASVSDLHQLVGLPTVHTDLKWGWDRLVEANIRQVREGWLLELPPAESI